LRDLDKKLEKCDIDLLIVDDSTKHALGKIDNVMIELHMTFVPIDFPGHPVARPVTPGSSLGPLDCPHRSTLVFSVHFVLTRAHPGSTSRSVTHPQIAPGQARLTWSSFQMSFRKRRYTLLI
jgi:hypothetical protein